MKRAGFLLAAFALLGGACSKHYLAARPPAAPSAPEAVRHETGFFTGAGGLQIFEQSWHPAGAPRGVLIVVHGLLDHGSRYAAFAEELVGRGFAVYALDLRGHAHSEGGRVWVKHFDEYLEDLDVLLARVRAAEPGRPVFLFGHSMGGAIVTLFTVTRKPDVAGVVLSGAALGIDAPGVQLFGLKVIAALAPHAGALKLKLKDFSRDPAVVAACEADPLVWHKATPARTAKELVKAVRRIEKSMEDVTVPLLVLHGTADAVTPPRGSKALFDRARSVDKALKLYGDFFHDLLHEPDHARVSADIAAWLEAHAAAHP